MKRAFDIGFAVVGILLALPLFLTVALAVKLTSPGPALYWSDRVGRNSVLFSMPKFRTMRTDTPALPTHLLTDAKSWLTPVGGFLRRTSLDEIPQLWSVLKGDMSVVGPRPALFNQHDLMALRRAHGIDALTPGLTGWAQINGRDALSIPDKVALEEYYRQHRSMRLDLLIILRTVRRVLFGDSVSH